PRPPPLPYTTLFRSKLRAEPDALPELQAQLRDQLDALDQASDTEALARRADEAHSAYNALAKQLTQARKATAKRLAKQVTDAMQDRKSTRLNSSHVK